MVTVNLIARLGGRHILAVVLYFREQARGPCCAEDRWRQDVLARRRHAHELEILVRNGSKTVIVELQGSLFFGTANQLYQALKPEIGPRTYVILNMRRVQSLDLTATQCWNK